MSELKPCPFCGANRIIKVFARYAQCEECGADGPHVSTANDASTMWNKRAALTPAPADGWVSVKDRLPERYEQVIACGSSGNVPNALLMHNNGSWYIGSTDQRYNWPIAYWQPLPAPPTEGARE